MRITLLLVTLAQSQFIVSEDGDSLAILEGSIQLPESRNKQASNSITLFYQIAKSHDPNSQTAVFMLAGGPGGSWLNTAELSERFAEIQMYQEHADVVIFDQRGAGRSEPNLSCKGIIDKVKIKQAEPDRVNDARVELATECRDYWLSQGVDLKAYNTEESSRDIDDLRKHLGYEEIILVGGSYGSHLGLHYVKRYPEHVRCAIFHGIEGPDHTLDMPGQVLNTYRRIAEATEGSAYYADKLKGQSLLDLHEAYLNSLAGKKDESKKKLIANFILSYKAGKRSNLAIWPNNLLDLYAGEKEFSKAVEDYLKTIAPPHAMNNMMDAASWATPERIEQIKHDPANKIIGAINEGYFFKASIWPDADLGASFRSPVTSDVPILLIHGTWDTSTPIENAMEVKEHLSNEQFIKVIHGSHNAYYELLREWEPMQQFIASFIDGEGTQTTQEVTLDLEFPELFPEPQIRFWDAVLDGNVNKAKAALNDQVDINRLDTRTKKTGRTALNWAAWRGDVEMMRFLLAHGADINVTNKSGYTPIHHAVENCQVKAYSFLLEQGADTSIASRNGRSLRESAKLDCPKLLELIPTATD